VEEQASNRSSSKVVALDIKGEIESKEQIRQMADFYRLTEADLEERKIIHSGMRDAKFLNVFRELRTKLMRLSTKQSFSVMVTSIVSESGSSFLARNIAASFALDASKTAVIVECHNNSDGSDWQIDGAGQGLSYFLESPVLSAEEVIYATGIPRLRIVPVGSRAVGSENFTSYRMKQFHEEVCGRYSDRYIIIDAPPVGESADAQILSELVDFIVVCVPYGMVVQDQIKKSIAKLPSEKVAGLIFNHAK